MRKAVLVIFILFSLNSINAQINSLPELLMYSTMQLDSFALTLEADKDWKTLPPTRNDDGSRYSEKYHFGYNANGKRQIIIRTVILNKNTGNVTESTSLIFDNVKLLEKFKNDLIKNDFDYEPGGKAFLKYTKDKSIVMIQLESTDKNKLLENTYKILIINTK